MSSVSKDKQGAKPGRKSAQRIAELVDKFAADFGPKPGGKHERVGAVELLVKLRRGDQ